MGMSRKSASFAAPVDEQPTAEAQAMKRAEVAQKDASIAKELGKDFLFMGLTMTLDIYASKLAAKDKNLTGVDDAIAAEMSAFANKIRKFQLTGVWEAAPGL